MEIPDLSGFDFIHYSFHYRSVTTAPQTSLLEHSASSCGSSCEL